MALHLSLGLGPFGTVPAWARPSRVGMWTSWVRTHLSDAAFARWHIWALVWGPHFASITKGVYVNAYTHACVCLHVYALRLRVCL